MKSFIIFLAIIPVIIIFSVAENEKSLYENFLYVVGVNCTSEPDYMTNLICSVKTVRRGVYLVDMDWNFVKLVKNVTIRLNFFKLSNGYRYRQGWEINACDMFAKRTFHPVTNTLMKLLKRFTNMNHTCPYSGHVSVRNGYLPTEFIGSLIPQGKYKIVFHLTEGSPPLPVFTHEFYLESDIRFKH